MTCAPEIEDEEHDDLHFSNVSNNMGIYKSDFHSLSIFVHFNSCSCADQLSRQQQQTCCVCLCSTCSLEQWPAHWSTPSCSPSILLRPECRPLRTQGSGCDAFLSPNTSPAPLSIARPVLTDRLFGHTTHPSRKLRCQIRIHPIPAGCF